jgi:diketogulonate reductase-like aldo/keto reductase
MHQLNRRKFLAQSSAFAAAAALPGGLLAEESMRTRRIPGTDEYLPVVGLGAPDVFVNLPEEGKDLPVSLIQNMMDLGGRVIDTPAFFRPDVPVIGDLINEQKLQRELFLIGKITVSGKQEGVEHLERTAANLGKEPMDLLLVHNMRDMNIHWPTLKDWKEAGRVRYIGVSLTRTEDYSQLEQFMKVEQPDFIMVRHSIHHPHTGDRVLPLAVDSGIAVIGIEAFKTDEDGGLFGLVAGKPLPEWAAEFDCDSWAQFALKYMLSNPAVTCVVTETSKVMHVVDNMQAGYGRLPDAATRKKMSDYLLSL